MAIGDRVCSSTVQGVGNSAKKYRCDSDETGHSGIAVQYKFASLLEPSGFILRMVRWALSSKPLVGHDENR